VPCGRSRPGARAARTVPAAAGTHTGPAIPGVGVAVAAVSYATRGRDSVAPRRRKPVRRVGALSPAAIQRLGDSLSLSDALEHGEEDQRRDALSALSRREDPEAIALLRRATAGHDPDWPCPPLILTPSAAGGARTAVKAELRHDAGKSRLGPAGADVCLVLEGTYPYVRGGVSTWVHDLLGGLPELRFAIVHIGAEQWSQGPRRYALPPNVLSLSDLYCREPLPGDREAIAQARVARAEHQRHSDTRRPSRVLRGIRRLLLEDRFDASLLDDLGSGDLSASGCLHGRPCFELTVELYERLAPEASFLGFFWNLRSMVLPLVSLLAAAPPPAAMYHALCTGYAGIVAAVWSHRTGRPFLLTEHGIYTRERNLELDRVAWVRDAGEGRQGGATHKGIDDATASGLRTVWRRFFRALAGCTYAQASTIVSLCEASRTKQISDGAEALKTLIIPNGVDLDARVTRPSQNGAQARDRRPGRVPIRHHADSRMLSRVAVDPAGRAHVRPGRRGSAVRRTVPAAGREARSRARGAVRTDCSDRQHLFADRHAGPHQLQ
jgi:hypothetical protein